MTQQVKELMMIQYQVKSSGEVTFDVINHFLYPVN